MLLFTHKQQQRRHRLLYLIASAVLSSTAFTSNARAAHINTFTAVYCNFAGYAASSCQGHSGGSTIVNDEASLSMSGSTYTDLKVSAHAAASVTGDLETNYKGGDGLVFYKREEGFNLVGVNTPALAYIPVNFSGSATQSGNILQFGHLAVSFYIPALPAPPIESIPITTDTFTKTFVVPLQWPAGGPYTLSIELRTEVAGPFFLPTGGFASEDATITFGSMYFTDLKGMPIPNAQLVPTDLGSNLPEPSAAALLLSGLIGVGILKRYSSKQH